MSRVRADKLVNRAGSGAPELTYGAQVLTGMGITGACLLYTSDAADE